MFFLSEYSIVISYPWDVREPKEAGHTTQSEPRHASAGPIRFVRVVWLSGSGGRVVGAAGAADGLG